jgi:hypothetical protein
MRIVWHVYLYIQSDILTNHKPWTYLAPMCSSWAAGLISMCFSNPIQFSCAHLFHINVTWCYLRTSVRFMFRNRLPPILASHGSVSQVIYIHEILYENALCISSLCKIKYLQYHEYVRAYIICIALFRAEKYKLSVIRKRRPQEILCYFSFNSLKCNCEFRLLQLFWDRLCCLVVRVPGYKSRGSGSVPGATRFSEK